MYNNQPKDPVVIFSTFSNKKSYRDALDTYTQVCEFFETKKIKWTDIIEWDNGDDKTSFIVNAKHLDSVLKIIELYNIDSYTIVDPNGYGTMFSIETTPVLEADRVSVKVLEKQYSLGRLLLVDHRLVQAKSRCFQSGYKEKKFFKFVK